MRFKKSGKHIFGVELTAAEQKAVDAEIYRQLAIDTRKHNLEIVSMTLAAVLEVFDCTEEELKQFFDTYDVLVDGLIDRYELAEDDGPWIAMYKLKEQGIDVEAWYAEAEASRK